MDGRSKYARMKKMIEALDIKEIHIDKLKLLIAMEIGSGEKTISDTLHQLDTFGFIKEFKPFWFKIK